ncbi:MAG: formylglycine-generating enzyme family protein [Magnetococcales bacterium]|nr:formylglycine-generating enzyme family protein [Magnetococcales bacterium]
MKRWGVGILVAGGLFLSVGGGAVAAPLLTEADALQVGGMFAVPPHLSPQPRVSPKRRDLFQNQESATVQDLERLLRAWFVEPPASFHFHYAQVLCRSEKLEAARVELKKYRQKAQPQDENRAEAERLEKDCGKSRPPVLNPLSVQASVASPKSVEGQWRDPVTGMVFVQLPKGCFQMGRNRGYTDESPAHEVCVDGFWLAKHEVTQGQWQQVMGDNPAYFKIGDDHPVESVSFNDAQLFIRRLNGRGPAQRYRLPTEAEWEYACRSGGRHTDFCGEGALGKVAWFMDNSGMTHHPVGELQPNAFGLHDMNGNVWEWVGDRYGADYYGQSPRHNPQGPGQGEARVNRGGSWFDGARQVGATVRYRYPPGHRDRLLGFRLLMQRP